MSSDSREIRVNKESLPYSLSVDSKVDAIYAAREIVNFLSLATDGITGRMVEDGTPGPLFGIWSFGMIRCFALASDLLSVALNEKDIPLAGGKDHPDFGALLEAGDKALKSALTQNQKG